MLIFAISLFEMFFSVEQGEKRNRREEGEEKREGKREKNREQAGRREGRMGEGVVKGGEAGKSQMMKAKRRRRKRGC